MRKIQTLSSLATFDSAEADLKTNSFDRLINRLKSGFGLFNLVTTSIEFDGFDRMNFFEDSKDFEDYIQRIEHQPIES